MVQGEVRELCVHPTWFICSEDFIVSKIQIIYQSWSRTRQASFSGPCFVTFTCVPLAVWLSRSVILKRGLTALLPLWKTVWLWRAMCHGIHWAGKDPSTGAFFSRACIFPLHLKWVTAVFKCSPWRMPPLNWDSSCYTSQQFCLWPCRARPCAEQSPMRSMGIERPPPEHPSTHIIHLEGRDKQMEVEDNMQRVIKHTIVGLEFLAAWTCGSTL